MKKIASKEIRSVMKRWKGDVIKDTLIKGIGEDGVKEKSALRNLISSEMKCERNRYMERNVRRSQ